MMAVGVDKKGVHVLQARGTFLGWGSKGSSASSRTLSCHR